MPVLRVISGPAAGRELTLTGRIVIGREKDCDLRLEDKEVSRHHAAVELCAERVVLCDLGSANGTFVGGLRVSEVPLMDGGHFQVGASEIVLLAHPENIPVINVSASEFATPVELPGVPAASQAQHLKSAEPAAGPKKLFQNVSSPPLPPLVKGGRKETPAVVLPPLTRGGRGGNETAPKSRLIGDSPKFAAAVGLALKTAPGSSAVLIRGPSGAGKELVARLIHEQSPRSQRPFLSVNCAALPGGRQDNELFGYERGAFPAATQTKSGYFKLAGGGALFLEEAGELALATQMKVLHAIEHGEIFPFGNAKPVRVEMRVIAATCRDLAAEAEAGRFNKDLYRRLAGALIELPPLAERPGDVRLLVQYFLTRKTAETGQLEHSISEPALAALERYSWPGNIRELCAVIERAMTTASQTQLEIGDFPPEITGAA